jgi:hypothetical protein
MSKLGNEGRAVATLEERIGMLERRDLLKRQEKHSPGSVERTNCGTRSWIEELEEMTQEAKRITEQAKTAGDLRTAVACIRLRCGITELGAKLGGDLDERSPTNILNVTLDSETARRIAETYLERHRPPEVESE